MLSIRYVDMQYSAHYTTFNKSTMVSSVPLKEGSKMLKILTCPADIE